MGTGRRSPTSSEYDSPELLVVVGNASHRMDCMCQSMTGRPYRLTLNDVADASSPVPAKEHR